MGQVVAPFAVKGWVKVKPYTDTPGALLDYPVWWLGEPEQARAAKVIQAHVHGPSVVALLEGCADREAAARLNGALVSVRREELPPAATDEYYWRDLIGLAVVNRQGVSLGRVDRLLATGANDVLVVEGSRERLIPFVGAIVSEVDLTHRRIVVDWEPDF
ncbi:MAG: ribosome maturation factor RimM [Betaproteobacteria bacterium]|nr:ribosome maturation factor RimM [Betaproteobacteria bacterium]